MPTSALSSLRDAAEAHPLETEPVPLADGPGFQPRQLVLLGAGDAHLLVLERLAKEPMVGIRITLVAPYGRQMVADRMQGMVSGRLAADDCMLPLEPLVRRSGVRWLSRSVRALNVAQRTVELDDGSEVSYDWLSINTGPVQHRVSIEERMPGAREYGLFLHPMESFAALWPQVAAIGDTRPLSVVVIGGGRAGIETAMAIRQRLPASAITVINTDHPPGARFAPEAQQRILAALKARKIMVIIDRVTAIYEHAVQLQSGATLRCDVPLIATGAQIPTWLAESGLQCTDQGFLEIDATLRSTNHPEVFAAGFVAHSPGPAGTTLLAQLSATVQGKPLRVRPVPARKLAFVGWGDGRGLMLWGRLHFQGRWVNWLREQRERRYVARYSRG